MSTSADSAYQDVVNHVLTNGTWVDGRNGRTLSCFGVTLRYGANPFPMLTLKKVSWRNVLTEMLWMIRGHTNVGWLHYHNNHIWDDWADVDGDLGPIYGFQWREQLPSLIQDIREQPESRRLVLSAWHPDRICDMVLPPCHAFVVFNVKTQRLNLHLTQRSCDVGIGLPYNMAGYGFLLSLMGHLTGLATGEILHTLVDAHIYESHIGAVREYVAHTPKPPPRLVISDVIQELEDVYDLCDAASTEELIEVFELHGYESHGAVRLEVMP